MPSKTGMAGNRHSDSRLPSAAGNPQIHAVLALETGTGVRLVGKRQEVGILLPQIRRSGHGQAVGAEDHRPHDQRLVSAQSGSTAGAGVFFLPRRRAGGAAAVRSMANSR